MYTYAQRVVSNSCAFVDFNNASQWHNDDDYDNVAAGNWKNTR